MWFHVAFSCYSEEKYHFHLLDPTVPYAIRGDQTLPVTARYFAHYLLQHLRDPVAAFRDFGGGSIPTDQSSFSGRAAGSEIASGGSNPCERDYVLTQYLPLFVTATFLLGEYFLPVAVVLSGGVKQVKTLHWHITLKGSLYGPIYGIYMGWCISYSISLSGT